MGASIIGTNLIDMTTGRLLAGFGDDITVTSGHGICGYSTGIIHFVECATNIQPGTAWTTNASITATTTGVIWAGSFVVEATNALYMILDGASLDSYPTNIYHGTVNGTYQYFAE